jgi:hypothetical protein
VIALLGIWTNCLVVNDGGVQLSAGWLGNAWDLYFSQLASRAVSMIVAFGPAWAAREAFDLGPASYAAAAHLFYFAVPLFLWAAIRAIEPHRAFSRLYLATVDGRCCFIAFRRRDGIPFECAPVEQTFEGARGEAREMFLRFLDEHYCVR